MGLWDTVKTFFTGMISIYIDFNQNCFSALVSKNGKPASYRIFNLLTGAFTTLKISSSIQSVYLPF